MYITIAGNVFYSSLIIMFVNQVGALEEGSTFGEMALFEESHVREFTVKAKTFCELFTLDSQSLDKALVTLYGEDAGMI